ncbi:MAG: hypothetical protein ABFS35_16395 [Bacteroidota bacterium]
MNNQNLISIATAFLTVILVSCDSKTDERNQQTENNPEQIISVVKKESTTKRLLPEFKVTEYCDREDQDTVMFYLAKFDKREPFNISVAQAKSALKIKYSVIDDCCLKYRGKASLDSVKLNLYHLKRAGNPCECFCMYEFEFVLRNTDIPDKLFINKKEVEFIQDK